MPDNVTGGASTAPVTTANETASNENDPSAADAASKAPGSALGAPVTPERPEERGMTPDQKKMAEVRRFKLKVDGREEELDEDSVLKLAQMGRASSKRFQEAAQMRKQAEDFVELLKRDPKAVLSNPLIGVDLRKFAEEYLAEQLEAEMLTPEQKKLKDLERQLKQYEDEKRQAKEQRQQQEFQQLQEHYAAEYENKITDALQTSGLPKTAFTVKRMSDYMIQALNNGIDVEPGHVVELVRQDYLRDISALFDQTSGDTLLQLLGDGVANKIRKADLARLTGGQVKPTQPETPQTEDGEAQPQPTPKVPARASGEKKPMNIHEWRAELEKRVKG